MSQMVYNGVSLQVVTIKEWLQENIYSDDGADLLHTHHRLHVRAVVAAGATEGNLDGIMDNLMQPRAKLLFGVSGKTMLEAPSVAGASCDANNGPHPIACTALEFRGEATAVIEFVIETWIGFGNTALIAHRWEMAEDIDEMFYSTRIIDGEAVFRSDLLFGAGLSVDQFRASLFHPIPAGYKRAPVHVEASSDGLRLRYQIVDEQQTLSFGNNSTPIIKIEGEYTSGNDCPIMTGPGFMTCYAQATVRVWGQRLTKRNDLVAAIARIMAGLKLPASIVAGKKINWMLGVKTRLTVDIVGKYAEAEVGWLASNGAELGVLVKTGAAAFLVSFAESTPGVGFIAPQACPSAIGGNGSRSDSLIALVTQALTTPGVAPGKPQ